ncbi:hypothetical protein [Sulfurovum sp.]|uniref:hypothetical protein n=1 Tax=Sulfurovum sp. TaxID=1969726 RepID=UPI0035687112
MNQKYITAIFLAIFTSTVNGGDVVSNDRQDLINELMSGAGKPQQISSQEAFDLAGKSLQAHMATKMHPLYLELCEDKNSLSKNMDRFKESLSDLLPLGALYFEKGIFINYQNTSMHQPSQELKGGLSYVLLGTRADFRRRSKSFANESCTQFIDALNLMSKQFSG